MNLLAFWPSSDFHDFFKPAFLRRDDLNVELVTGDRTNSCSLYAAPPQRLRELRRRLEAGEFDLVISGSIWTSRFPPHQRFWTQLATAARYSTYKRRRLDTDLVPGLMRNLPRPVPLAVLDLRDAHYVLPGDLPLLEAATLYFKRELFAWPRRSLLPLMTWDDGRRVEPLQSKLRPLSYGIHPSRVAKESPPLAERDIDLFMTGGGNPVREDIRRRVEALAGKYRVVITDRLVAEQEYRGYLRRAKLAVCTESFGCETWRQYDVAAAGAVPLINHPFVLHHAPMEPDVHAIFFSLAGHDFEAQVARALGNPDLLQRISTATREFTLATKSRARIADYVIAETLAAASPRLAE